MILQRMTGLLLGALLCAIPTSFAQAAPPQAASPAQANTFTDPLLDDGPDPWVVGWKGFYYYLNSTGSNLTLRKTADITDLRHAQKKAVWTPEPNHPWSKDLWAPELHRWDNKWYIYFAADAGQNADHRIYVVENDSDDPIEGTWIMKGKISDPSDNWAIDATTFELHGQHYLVWAGWKGATDGEQDLYIAHMSNPWTIDSPRTLISKPTFPWEQHGDLPNRHVNVNEGPEFLAHGNKMFIVFSASGCWTDFYTLGVLEASTSANPLEASTWNKIDHPFLSTDPTAGAFGPGHNGFFKSPDGKQDWIIYHANPKAGEGCGNLRSPRIQQFTWNKLGRPQFGKPVPIGEPLQKPAQ
ncbi:glycoside hydrolase family 43 protein [Granulicella arctica]|uniref:glycoside hydrolase family 43 protein n=1 Tax=Granulicella arctica TaxID=940613 RepID=UPI0021E0EC77|nr:glycoside hydrolase family 43 protein [Granulicella arctica]